VEHARELDRDIAAADHENRGGNSGSSKTSFDVIPSSPPAIGGSMVGWAPTATKMCPALTIRPDWTRRTVLPSSMTARSEKVSTFEPWSSEW
jgi:hypothetical protein